MKIITSILCFLALAAGAQVNQVYPGRPVYSGMLFSTNAAPTGSTATAPGFAVAAEGHNLNSASTLAVPITAVGANRAYLIGVAWYAGASVGVTNSAGIGATKLYQTNFYSGSGQVALFLLVAPAVGADTVTATWSSSIGEKAVAVLELTNCVQTSTVGTVAAAYSGASASVAAIQNTVSTTTTDLVVSLLADESASSTYTPDAPEVLRIDSQNSSSNCGAHMGTRAGAAGTTTSRWTISPASPVSLITVPVHGL